MDPDPEPTPVLPAMATNPAPAKVTAKSSYIDLRGIYLGAEFVRTHSLQAGVKYPILVAGLADTSLEGTLDKSSFIGGLAKMYRAFAIKDGDTLAVSYRDGQLHITPPADSKLDRLNPAPEARGVPPTSVFQKKTLKHLHIEPFSPGRLSSWEPRTETDVYMVFGVIHEVHDYTYCCGASKELLDSLGYAAATKPDAVVIDEATSEYLMAEFKIRSSDFKSNHKPDDVDLLVCWQHDETDNSVLPPLVLDLRSRIRKAIEEGDLDL